MNFRGLFAFSKRFFVEGLPALRYTHASALFSVIFCLFDLFWPGLIWFYSLYTWRYLLKMNELWLGGLIHALLLLCIKFRVCEEFFNVDVISINAGNNMKSSLNFQHQKWLCCCSSSFWLFLLIYQPIWYLGEIQ